MSKLFYSPLYRIFGGLLLLMMLPSFASAEGGLDTPTTSPSPESPFYDVHTDKGFYWYIDPAEIEKIEQQLKEEKQNQLPQYTYEELWNMHPDKFTEYREESTKFAVQRPTFENVERHLYVQDVARRKSLAFASVVGLVGQLNPEFSTEDIYPASAPGRRALSQTRNNEINETLYKGREGFALLIFNQLGCHFCEAQAPIIQNFEAYYEWPVKNIDIDIYADLASQYNIQKTPSILVISKDTGKSMPISSGIIDLGTIKKRVARAIRYLNGEVDPQQWYLNDFQKGSGTDPLTLLQSAKNKDPNNLKGGAYE